MESLIALCYKIIFMMFKNGAKNRLSLNCTKSYVLISVAFILNNNKCKTNKKGSIRDLRVLFDHKLAFFDHMVSTVKSAYSTLNLI